MGVFDPEHKEMLHSPERRKILPPEKIIDFSGLNSTDVVVDYGCGNGYLTVEIAKSLKTPGVVYAVDISEEMLSDLIKRLDDDLKDIVIPILLSDDVLPVESGSVDIFFAVNVMHEAEEPTRIVREAYRVLKKSGKIAVVEWKKEETPKGPPLAERISAEEMKEMLEKYGYGSFLIYEFPYHYLILGMKKNG
jgi:ubiquinone/menaquinone biosynthesis C-methylase UbiE